MPPHTKSCAPSVSRRKLLTGFSAVAAGVAAGPPAFARSVQSDQRPDWRIGFQNAPDAGIATSPLTRVLGRAPGDLHGVLSRNGPGQFTWGADRIGHWFDGDGFVRAYRISEGAARMSGRFVDTHKRRVDRAAQRVVMPGFGTSGAPDAPVAGPDDVNAANTSLLRVGEELWALWEAGSPVALDPETLATRGVRTLRADLAGMAFSAHPKVDPSGQIWNFGAIGNRLFIWSLNAAGAVVKSAVATASRPAYLHDWAVSRTKLIIPLQPWVLTRSTPPFVDSLEWRPDMGLEVLVIDKDDFSRTRTYELPAASFFHTGNAWEDLDGTIRFDACLSDDASFGAHGARDLVRGITPQNTSPTSLALITLRPDGTASVERLKGDAEFPRTDPRRQGARHDRVAHVDTMHTHGWGFRALAVHDWSSGRSDRFDFGPNHLVEEFVMVPMSGRARETDAWLVGTTLNMSAAATELHVFHAGRVGDGPLVSWRGPLTPLGFHGIWTNA